MYLAFFALFWFLVCVHVCVFVCYFVFVSVCLILLLSFVCFSFFCFLVVFFGFVFLNPFYCHDTWLVRSWFPEEEMDLSLWGGSIESRALVCDRTPDPREY